MQVIVRALRVLLLIGAGGPKGLSLTEVGSELDLPLPTVHRTLKVLIDEGVVYRDPDSLQYFLGEKITQLTRSAPDKMLGELAGPHVRMLSRQFDETVFVTQLIGTRAVCVALAESERPLRISVDIGRAMPLHAAASARVLLAWKDESSVRSLLCGYEMKAFTENTPVSVEDVLARLGRIREQGYETSADELDKQVWAASLPIRIGDGVAASLTIAAPMDRSASDGLRASMVESAHSVAADIEKAIGSRS